MNSSRTSDRLDTTPRIEESESPRLSSLLETSLEALVRFWTLPVLQRPWTRAAWFAGLAALCLVRVRIALAGVELFSHDVFAMFDPAWRMLHGQRPHIDFYSHLGVVAYLPTLLGMWLAQGNGQGFAYALGSSLAACLVGAWIYLVGRQRMAAMPLLVLVALTVLIVADPSTLGFSPLIFASITT